MGPVLNRIGPVKKNLGQFIFYFISDTACNISPWSIRLARRYPIVEPKEGAFSSHGYLQELVGWNAQPTMKTWSQIC